MHDQEGEGVDSPPFDPSLHEGNGTRLMDHPHPYTSEAQPGFNKPDGLVGVG